MVAIVGFGFFVLDGEREGGSPHCFFIDKIESNGIPQAYESIEPYKYHGMCTRELATTTFSIRTYSKLEHVHDPQ